MDYLSKLPVERMQGRFQQLRKKVGFQISNFKGSREKAIMLSIGNVFAFDYKYDDALLKIDVSEPILVGILMVAETNQ